MKRIIACLAAGTAFTATTPALVGAVVDDTGIGDAVVTLLEETTPPIYPGQDAWIAIPWTVSNAEAREFRVTSVSTDGIEVGYPENTATYSSLYNDDTLSPLEIDFTALRIRVDPESPAPRVLDITVSYVSDTGDYSEVISLPVAIDDSEFVGDGIAMDDGLLGEMASDDVAWFSVGLLGLENSSHVELRVIEPGPFDIVYPAERDHSRPNLGTDVRQGVADQAAIRFATSGVDEGSYSVTIEATYYVGMTRISTMVDRQIMVEGSGGSGGGSDVLYDSAANAGAWIINPNGDDTATTGQWDITNPEETSWQGHVTQLGYTPSGAPGVITTGAAGSDTGANDVDSGRTSAISPSISLPAGVPVELKLAYYFAYLENSSTADYLRISVVGESETALLLERTGKAENKDAQWKSKTFDLSNFAGQDVRILVEAADESNGSLVEAAVADIVVRVTGLTP